MLKNPPANGGDARDEGSIPGWGRSPEVGNGNPLQYSCLENSMDRGAWRATVHGASKYRTQLTNWAHTCPWFKANLKGRLEQALHTRLKHSFPVRRSIRLTPPAACLRSGESWGHPFSRSTHHLPGLWKHKLGSQQTGAPPAKICLAH